jgi:hypothetical protein
LPYNIFYAEKAESDKENIAITAQRNSAAELFF